MRSGRGIGRGIDAGILSGKRPANSFGLKRSVMKGEFVWGMDG